MPGKPTRIRLDLSRHCIETAIRKRYNHLVSEALRSRDPAERIEFELDLLKTALETFDFGRLRTTYLPLAGHGTEVVELEEEAPGRLQIRIDGKPVELVDVENG